MIACRVLGPIEVLVDDVLLALGGARPRRLLTALVAGDGRAVPDARLVDAVWGDEPPPKAPVALQVYVSRLRGALGPIHKGQLTRTSAGYRLQLAPDEVDATRFARAVNEGRRLLAAHRADDAVRELSDALALWRGEPYADLAATDAVEAARGRLTELRRIAAEELAAARLATGDAGNAVAELEELVRTAPLRERRWALLILGLYRCGRQGDALATARRVRALLADELGIDPGPELQTIEQRVLAQDPTLEIPEPATATPPLPTNRRRAVHRPLTSFLGREAELKTVAERLAEQRLVTLAGPAGVGKTRIAVEYTVTHQDADSSWLARLADVRQPTELPNVVADAIGLVAAQGDPTAAVIRSIADRPALLVLDNCEHVVVAAAELVVALLDGCPQLRILTTSREPLGIDGEITVPVRPLPLVGADGADGAAVALVLERVRMVRPDWTPSADDLDHARWISAALDGLPLAIELAAARARALGLGEISERLGDRFSVLGSVPRGALTPHATLEAAIAWSIEPLSDTPRALLLQLWPFEGGFTLDAAEAIRPAEENDTATLEALSTLVIRSIVVADTTCAPTRYLLLESIRAYCQSIDPDQDTTRQAHATWIRGLAAQCLDAPRNGDRGQFRRTLRRELPNIRAGLAHDREHNPLAALRSVGQFISFFVMSANTAEALALVRATMATAPDTPSMDRARATISLILLYHLSGDFAAARRQVTSAREACDALGDGPNPDEDAELYYFLALASVQVGAADTAIAAAERSIAISTAHGATWCTNLAGAARAAAHLLEAHGANDDAAVVEAADAVCATSRGLITAWAETLRAEAYLRHPGSSATTAAHRAAEARAALHRAATMYLLEYDNKMAIRTIYLGALALARDNRPVDAVRLLAAVHRHAERLAILTHTFLEPESTWVDDELADALDPSERAAAEADGAQLTWPDMIALLAPARVDRSRRPR